MEDIPIIDNTDLLHIPRKDFEDFFEQSKNTVEEKEKLKVENVRLRNEAQFASSQLELSTNRIDELEEQIEALENNKPVPVNMGKYFSIFKEHGKVEEPKGSEDATAE